MSAGFACCCEWRHQFKLGWRLGNLEIWQQSQRCVNFWSQNVHVSANASISSSTRPTTAGTGTGSFCLSRRLTQQKAKVQQIIWLIAESSRVCQALDTHTVFMAGPNDTGDGGTEAPLKLCSDPRASPVIYMTHKARVWKCFKHISICEQCT